MSAKKSIKQKLAGGQFLLEVLIAVGVGAIIIIAASAVIAPALRINTQATRAQAGASLARELLQNVRVLAEGDWHNISNLATSSANHYYLNVSSSPFAAISGDQTLSVSSTTFTRYFYVDDVYRDASDLIVQSGGSYDPSTKRITVLYSWPRSSTNSISQFITRNRNAVFIQTDWSGGPGQGGPATSTNSRFATSTDIDYATNAGSIFLTNPYSFPHFWEVVPGNSTLGTSDFWVMKYEAKCISSSSVPVGWDGYTASGFADNIYWGAPGLEELDRCVNKYGGHFASAPGGAPITDLTHQAALNHCDSLGQKFHLMTNSEWMTIARNAEQVVSNWTGGAVGSGLMYVGNDIYGPSRSWGPKNPASADDSDGFYLTPGDPNNPTEGGFGAIYTGATTTRRTLYLSNGSVLWDIAGNATEHAQKDPGDNLFSASDHPDTSGGAGTKETEFTEIMSYGIFSYQFIRPLNTAFNSTRGVGVLWHCNKCNNTALEYRVFRGSFASGASTPRGGVFFTFMNFGLEGGSPFASHQGFRCVKDGPTPPMTPPGSQTTPVGLLDSTIFDTGVSGGAELNSLLWHGSQPSGTSVEFQLAVSNSSSGPWAYKGPDGTDNTFYSIGPDISLPVNYTLHNNSRFFRYRVQLTADPGGAVSPRVDEVIVNWSP